MSQVGSTIHPRRPRATPLMEVRPSPIHGWGGFARRDLPAHTRVIEYTGQRISPEESDRRYPDTDPTRSHTVLFSLSNGRYIDAGVRGNVARFINHSCTPNCRAVEGGRAHLHRDDPAHRRGHGTHLRLQAHAARRLARPERPTPLRLRLWHRGLSAHLARPAQKKARSSRVTAEARVARTWC